MTSTTNSTIRTWSSVAGGVLLVCVLLGTGATDPEAEARAAIEATIAEVMPVLQNASLSQETKIDQLTEIAERRFDMKRMSALILGRNRKKLDEEQQAEFLVEFKRHITATYADGLDQVADERVEIIGTPLERNGDVTVQSRIVGGQADGVTLDYRMRAKDGPWRVIDVVIEGISVAQNFRSQVQQIVSAEGADRLIEILRTKNDRKEAAASASS